MKDFMEPKSVAHIGISRKSEPESINITKTLIHHTVFSSSSIRSMSVPNWRLASWYISVFFPELLFSCVVSCIR